jgi:hypothetical protein
MNRAVFQRSFPDWGGGHTVRGGTISSVEPVNGYPELIRTDGVRAAAVAASHSSSHPQSRIAIVTAE